MVFGGKTRETEATWKTEVYMGDNIKMNLQAHTDHSCDSRTIK
jgi:hypothetical protein